MFPMTREQLFEKSLESLRTIAKAQGVKSITKYRKAELVDIIMNGGILPQSEQQTADSLSQRDGYDDAGNDVPAGASSEPLTLPDEQQFARGAGIGDPDVDRRMEQEPLDNAPDMPLERSKANAMSAYGMNGYQQSKGYVRSDPYQSQQRGDNYQRRSYGNSNNYQQGYQNRDNYQRNDNYQRSNIHRAYINQGFDRQQTYNTSNYPQRQEYHQQEYQQQRQRTDGYNQQYNGSDANFGSYNRGSRPSEAYYNAEYGTSNPAIPEILESGECDDAEGVLEVMPDGYGFLRCHNYLPSAKDVYVSSSQIRRFKLKTGDLVAGKTRFTRENDRFVALMYITGVNGAHPEENLSRKPFDELIPIFPNERLTLEKKDEPEKNLAIRLIDLIAPIGKGQRGMIVSQPKAGKTTLLKSIANGISENYPDVHLIVLLIDERPEEVTDMQRSIKGEVVYSTFDELPENHTRVAEMVLERSMRLVETGKDVVVLMDSITRLARAYNLTINSTGKTLSGGMDPGALHKPKRFFGAARNIEDGGSLTVIATALVETGSRMDDMVYEEFKGTGNMEIHLDRKLSEKRIFPAVDIYKSGTRRDELLLTPDEREGVGVMRRMLANGNTAEVTEQVIAMLERSENNDEFISRLKNMMNVYEKEGYSIGRNILRK